MKAGRKLDALIAENVMEHTVIRERRPNGNIYIDSIGKKLPHYSANIADAWLVVEKFDDICVGQLINPKEWVCLINGEDTHAETAPLAICLAALKSVGVDVE